MTKQALSETVAIPGGIVNPPEIKHLSDISGKHRPVARQWVGLAGVKQAVGAE